MRSKYFFVGWRQRLFSDVFYRREQRFHSGKRFFVLRSVQPGYGREMPPPKKGFVNSGSVSRLAGGIVFSEKRIREPCLQEPEAVPNLFKHRNIGIILCDSCPIVSLTCLLKAHYDSIHVSAGCAPATSGGGEPSTFRHELSPAVGRFRAEIGRARGLERVPAKRLLGRQRNFPAV